MWRKWCRNILMSSSSASAWWSLARYVSIRELKSFQSSISIWTHLGLSSAHSALASVGRRYITIVVTYIFWSMSTTPWPLLLRRSLRIVVPSILCSTSTNSWLLRQEAFEFFILSTRTFLRWRPRGGIEFCSCRVVEGCNRKIVLKFPRTCVLYLFFVRMFS
jgi:hypothetical protein